MRGSGRRWTKRWAPRLRERAGARLDRAGERDLRQAAVCRDLVAAEEDAVAAIDGGTVPPRGSWEVERAAAAVHHLAATPRGPFAPTLDRDVEKGFQPGIGVRGGLTGTDGHMRLHELLAVGRQRWVVRGEALDPAGGLEVGHDVWIAAAVAQPEVQAERAAARPVERLVAEQPASVAELEGDDHGRLGQDLHPLAGGDLDAELACPALERRDQAGPAADDEARGRPGREQKPL